MEWEEIMGVNWKKVWYDRIRSEALFLIVLVSKMEKRVDICYSRLGYFDSGKMNSPSVKLISH